MDLKHNPLYRCCFLLYNLENNHNMKKIIFYSILSVLCTVAAYAVPATPYLITKTQPDGTEISYYLRGDEYFSCSVSEDGYLIKANSENIFEYARLTSKGIETTGIKVNALKFRTKEENLYLSQAEKVSEMEVTLKEINRQRRIQSKEGQQAPQRAYPLKGNPKSLVILVSYSDVEFKSSPADFTRLLNEKGYDDDGGKGSAKDYFLGASNGVFGPDFVVVGPYKLPQTRKYYGEQVGTQHDKNAQQMVIDACYAADNDVDFKEFDTDGDGRLDNVFIYYAGHNQAEGGGDDTIWPHRSSIYQSIKVDDVYLGDYACTSEYRSSNGSTRCGIATFCHEFGHVLGLPDWYDTSYSGHKTLGAWDIMDQGSYNNDGCNPPTYSSYERFYLGWLTPEILEEGKTYTAEPLLTSNKAYITSKGTHNLVAISPNPNEFFMVENRRKSNLDGVPAEGLLVTHVNYNAANWANNCPNNNADNLGTSIVCAFGDTGNPSANVFPGSTNKTVCDLILKSGEALPQLSSITKEGENITFFCGEDMNAPKIYIHPEIEEFVSYINDRGEKPEVVKADTKTVELIGRNLPGEKVSVELRQSVRSKFSLRINTEANDGEFNPSVNIPVESDGTIKCKIDIRYTPTTEDYGKTEEDLLIMKSDTYNTQVTLKGNIRREVIVVPPVANEAEEVSPYSFKASWNKIEDARTYYLTVYTVKDNESRETETFDKFDTEVPKGWQANFNTVQHQYKGSAPMAVFFKETENTLVTKEYMMAVSKISFWMHSMNSTGTLNIEAADATSEWTSIYTEECTPTTRNKTVTVDVPQTETGYTKFRIHYTTESSKTTDGLAFDDFTAIFNKEYVYVFDNYMTFSPNQLADPHTELLISNLTPGTTYIYNVKASDKDQYGRYENITAPSNDIVVTTLEGEDADSRNLTISLSSDKTHYVAFVDTVDPTTSLFIYSTDGRLLAQVPVESNIVDIPELKRGEIYIVKHSENGNQRRKTKQTKFFYSL